MVVSDAPKSVDVSAILGATPSKTPQRPGTTNQSMSFSQYPGHNMSGTPFLVCYSVLDKWLHIIQLDIFYYVACVTQRRHIGITICRLASASQNNFCHIFLRNHTGQLLDIWCRASVWSTVSCKTFESAACPLPVWRNLQYFLYRKNFRHIFLRNHTGQLLDIWHRASVWRTVRIV